MIGTITIQEAIDNLRNDIARLKQENAELKERLYKVEVEHNYHDGVGRGPNGYFKHGAILRGGR